MMDTVHMPDNQTALYVRPPAYVNPNHVLHVMCPGSDAPTPATQPSQAGPTDPLAANSPGTPAHQGEQSE
jgi:hypothetical protein